VGIDILSHCKEPSKQFALVEEHITALRKNLYRTHSKVIVIVERNLAFESEHHRHALSHLHNVTFYEDIKAGRVGVLTTDTVKFSAMEIVNTLLRERRVAICKHMHSRDKKGMLVLLREQFEIYSYQFKEAANTFQKGRTALSGKVGGCKDDVVICLQLGCYWTSVGVLEKLTLGDIA